MSYKNNDRKYKLTEVKESEELFYRFENILIPIIPTILIIIMGILFRIFSSKNKNKKTLIKKNDSKKEIQTENNNNIINKNKNSNKGSLLGGNPKYQKKNMKKIFANKFMFSIFKKINKNKGFDELDIENILKESFEEKKIKIDDLYFIDDFNYIKKYEPNIKNEEKNNINMYYLNENKEIKNNLYNINDLIKENKMININYNSKEIKILLSLDKYNNIKNSEDEILKTILNSWCINIIYKIFNINSDYKFGLSKDEQEDKYNLYLINNYITTKNKILDKKENKEILKNNNQKSSQVSNITINTSRSTNVSINDINNNNSNINKSENIINTNNATNTNNNNNNINIIINEDKNNANNQNNQNQINNNYNQNNTGDGRDKYNNAPMNNTIYIFPLIGLNNVGSTCFMNATLQCLLHISELNLYFLNEYPNDYNILRTKNSSSETMGNISLAYYNVINEVYLKSIQCNNNYYMNNNSFAPNEFKETLGKYNSQFRYYEANDSKDLILYLLQTFHEELNYFGDQPFPVNLLRPNQLNRADTFNYFNNTYNIQNFSIVSKLFYGTYENIIKCCNCNKMYFSYQKFEFISFSTYNYRNGIFNIYNGFQDNQAIQYLQGNNKYFCPSCQNLYDGETCCKIITPPSKLIINIDYGKNKINNVKQLIFDEMIDITSFINFDFGKKIIYQISGVCTHLGSSGPTGHYIAYCRNKQTGMWYNFNDSFVRLCDKNEIYRGSPYLLVYEQI